MLKQKDIQLIPIKNKGLRTLIFEWKTGYQIEIIRLETFNKGVSREQFAVLMTDMMVAAGVPHSIALTSPSYTEYLDRRLGLLSNMKRGRKPSGKSKR